MWTILYVADKDIFQLGPFPSRELALEAGKEADGEEFDLDDCNVYILGPSGVLEEIKHW